MIRFHDKTIYRAHDMIRLTVIVAITFLGIVYSGSFTKEPIKAGDFVIFYTGVFFEKYTWKCKLDSDVKKALAEYRIVNSDGLSVAAPMKSFDQGENLKKHPAAAANEPGKGAQANLFPMEGQFQTDDGVTHSYFALFACANIKADSELLWDYGDKFDGGYEKGENCSFQQIHKQNRKQELWAGLIVKLMHMKGTLSRKKKDVSNHVELIDKFIRDKKATALIKDQAEHIENWGEDTWRTLIVALIRNRKNPFVPLNVEEARKRALVAIEETEINITKPYNVIHSTWKGKDGKNNTEHESHAILDQKIALRTPHSSCNVTTNNPTEESEESEESEEE